MLLFQDAPIILVGTKTDLRKSQPDFRGKSTSAHHGKSFMRRDGHAKAAEIGAYKYVECSALNQV